MKQRDCNVELLRVVLMFLIVLGHMGLFGVKGGGLVGKGVESCTVFATDAFALISGWYGIRFSAKKIVHFLLVGLFAAIVLAALSPLVLDKFRFYYSLGWFGAAYLGLMFVAPIIDRCLDSFDGAWKLYALAMCVNWLPVRHFGINLSIPGWGDISFNSLCFMYVTGRALRKSQWVEKVTVLHAGLAFSVLMVVNIAWAAIGGFSEPGGVIYSLLIGTRSNNSPLVVALAVAIFLLFKKALFPRSIGRVATFLAPSMFFVYLLHEGCNGQLSRRLYNTYLFCNLGGSIFMDIFSMGVSAVLVMLVCIMIDLFRRVAFQTVSRVICH